MPTLTIDGKQITVEPGTKVIEAAKRLGIFVPFYCYHPGLSIAGNCRICMVEIGKIPRTQIACNTDCAEGMVVHTQSEKAKDTRRHILEFILANHPLDCPVCDQAGECWLQDYYMRYGLYDARFYEQKVKKEKAVSIGPTVMLDAERCILCSRCVRFADEITKTSELGIVNRGDHSEITVHPDRELNNKYSGNVVDICPVGALTDKDFRFKCRVWYLQKADSICPGCSRGCNIEIHSNLDRPQHGVGERVMRLKPRENPEVNQWWICDAGRYGYKFIDQKRIARPQVHPAREMVWDEILNQVAYQIKETKKPIGVFVSPQLSNEELFLVRRLFGKEKLFLISPCPDGDQDDFLIRADKNPNRRGAELLGFSSASVQTVLASCKSSSVEGVFIFGQDILALIGSDLKSAHIFENFKWSVFMGSNSNPTSESASYVLSSATHAEKNGTFTNFEGRIQKFNKAFEPLAESRPEWVILTELANRLGAVWSYRTEEEVFTELAREVSVFHELTYEKIGSQGVLVGNPVLPRVA